MASLLGEDEDILGLVINKVKDKQDRKSFSEVCKKWFKLEGLDRSSLKINLSRSRVSLVVLTRFPNLVHFELWNFKSHTELEFVARTCPKIEWMTIESKDGNLSPILLNNTLISDESLRAIESATWLTNLELIRCPHITDEGLVFLANGSISKTLKRLDLDIWPKITDSGIELLNKMCSLELLELSGRGKAGHKTDIGGVGISAVRTLKELRLNNLGVSDVTMVALAHNCLNLEKLDIAGCEIKGNRSWLACILCSQVLEFP